MKKRALIVTTEHRGVFFGYGKPTTEKTIRLTEARMCVYWSADVKGVVGLAANGPTSGCRIGPAAPAITLQGVMDRMAVQTGEIDLVWQGEKIQKAKIEDLSQRVQVLEETAGRENSCATNDLLLQYSYLTNLIVITNGLCVTNNAATNITFKFYRGL